MMENKTVFAYVRVSTQMQALENQKYEIQRWADGKNIPISRWTTESVSGTISWEKRNLGSLLKKMKRGDMLVCTEISRLGRNMLMIMSILNFCSQKGLQIHTIKDNFDLTDSINSKIIAFAFALAAEIERNLISQRTKEALAAKRESGVKLGRPKGSSTKVKKIEEDAPAIRVLLRQGEHIEAIARKYGVHRNTMSRCIRIFKIY